MMLPLPLKNKNIQRIPIKRELITREPNPGQKLIPFIGWIKKRAGVRTLKECNKKCKKEGIDIEEFKKIGADLICIYRYKGEKVVVLKDLPWADQWATYYGIEIPHHSHFVSPKRKFFETERKV